MYWAEKLGIWNQEVLELKVKERLQVYKDMENAVTVVAEELSRMDGVCCVDISDPEITISGDMVEVSWWESGPCGGDDRSKTFPTEYLWDFDWKEKKEKADMDRQLERLRANDEAKKAEKVRLKEQRREHFEELKKEFGDE